MKIASWNINSLRKRQGRLLDWLSKEKPDVVCLQETKCSDDQFPELELSAAGYRCVFHGQKSYNGVAILSQHELLGREAALCAESDDPQARVIAATINGMRVFSIYAPNGQAVGSPAFHYKLQWFVQLRDCVVKAQESFPQVIVCGDFNVAPEDRDVYDPRLWRGAGGIIGCWRFKKIADYASTRSWQANHWPHAAPPPESISKCVKARIRPITPPCGRSSLLCHPERSDAKSKNL